MEITERVLNSMSKWVDLSISIIHILLIFNSILIIRKGIALFWVNLLLVGNVENYFKSIFIHHFSNVNSLGWHNLAHRKCFKQHSSVSNKISDLLFTFVFKFLFWVWQIQVMIHSCVAHYTIHSCLIAQISGCFRKGIL